jgi:hypothetical protein
MYRCFKETPNLELNTIHLGDEPLMGERADLEAGPSRAVRGNNRHARRKAKRSIIGEVATSSNLPKRKGIVEALPPYSV